MKRKIGISGWTYAPWRGGFFPRDLPQPREVFTYFDNTDKLRAARGAEALIRKSGQCGQSDGQRNERRGEERSKAALQVAP
jgi:uncharacterized protein YecE (DUF72 family)